MKNANILMAGLLLLATVGTAPMRAQAPQAVPAPGQSAVAPGQTSVAPAQGKDSTNRAARRVRAPRPPRPGIFTSLDSAKTMPDSVLYLNLRGKGLGSITGLSAFKNLVAIDLSGNNLTSFPMDVIKLGKLTSIDLSDNPIKTVPAEIGTLASLSRLNLRNTGITTLPAQIGNCSSLAALDVSKNPLASLPIKELNLMPKLRGITLGRPETEGGAAPVPANAPVSPKK